MTEINQEFRITALRKFHEIDHPGSQWEVATSAPPAATVSAAQRGAVVLLALAVLFWRMPSAFTHPQFWGEDIFFFYGARFDGLSSVLIPLGGYLTAAQYVVALLTSPFNPVFAPALYCYSAILLSLLIVWMVTSPRLDMPLKPLLAIATVVVPMGREELGVLCNIQWILPIGAFAILFMRAPNSKWIIAFEAIFIALMATSGPFSIFLAPMFAWRTFVTDDPSERPRLVLLTIIVALAGIVQGLEILAHPFSVAASPYPWTLWVSLPLRKIMTTLSAASRYFDGVSGVSIGAILVTIAGVLACMRPYRAQKIFMLLFSLLVVVGGLYKFRHALGGQTGAQRYYYAASVFTLWFICCLSARPYLRTAMAAGVLVAELVALPVIKDRSRQLFNSEWSVWAGYIPSGLPLVIPTPPGGWYMGLPAANVGPLSQFKTWVGRNINEISSVDPLACRGFYGTPAELLERGFVGDAFDPSTKAWIMAGWAADDRSDPVRLIAIADETNRVVGFGLTGFETKEAGPPRSGWNAIYSLRSGNAQAFGVIDDGKRVCPLSTSHGDDRQLFGSGR
jgi:hypothetical protein